MAAAPPVIDVRNLSYSYREKTVLTGISFSIGGGETWSIIGKNGVGKSTLIKCIAGLLAVRPGSILINGIDIAALKPRDRARIISYVPQATVRGLASYNVFDFVMLARFPYQGLMAIPTESDNRIVDEALALTDVDGLRDRFMTTLSGGELQRVFLAGAVAQESSILLLDEPATFLDPLHQQLVSRTLDRIHNEFGSTIVTITHDVNFAVTKFSNVLALVNGTLFFAGTTARFKANCPAVLNEIFTVRFEEARCFGSNRMIIVPGEEA
jgi:iron complex transport system ATP-binding protein